MQNTPELTKSRKVARCIKTLLIFLKACIVKGSLGARNFFKPRKVLVVRVHLTAAEWHQANWKGFVHLASDDYLPIIVIDKSLPIGRWEFQVLTPTEATLHSISELEYLMQQMMKSVNTK